MRLHLWNIPAYHPYGEWAPVIKLDDKAGNPDPVGDAAKGYWATAQGETLPADRPPLNACTAVRLIGVLPDLLPLSRVTAKQVRIDASKIDFDFARRAFDDLAATGAEPDTIITDHEQGPLYWRQDNDRKAAWTGEREAYERAAVRAITPLYDKLLDLFQASFGYRPVLTDYTRTRADNRDYNDWIHPACNVKVSAPSCYIETSGGLLNQFADPVWASFVQAVNNIRACLAAGPTRPWITSPDAFAADFPAIWQYRLDLMWHAYLAGCEGFHVFNPRDHATYRFTADGELDMQRFESQTTAVRPRLKLPALPLECDAVETAGFMTRKAA